MYAGLLSGFVNPKKAGNRGWINNSGSGNYSNGLNLKTLEIFSSSFSSSRSLYLKWLSQLQHILCLETITTKPCGGVAPPWTSWFSFQPGHCLSSTTTTAATTQATPSLFAHCPQQTTITQQFLRNICRPTKYICRGHSIELRVPTRTESSRRWWGLCSRERLVSTAPLSADQPPADPSAVANPNPEPPGPWRCANIYGPR